MFPSIGIRGGPGGRGGLHDLKLSSLFKAHRPVDIARHKIRFRYMVADYLVLSRGVTQTLSLFA